jgi:adenylate cyclase
MTARRRASLSDVRHDLLTPVNHLLGYSEMILEDCEDHGLESHLPQFEDIRTLARQLQGAIDRVLPSSPQPAGDGELRRLQTELREPLDRMFRAIDGVEREAPQTGPSGFVEDIAKIRTAADRLNRQVHDLTSTSEARGASTPAAPDAVTIPDAVVMPASNVMPDAMPKTTPPQPPRPVAPAAAVAPSGAPTARPGIVSGGRLLVVDDDASNRDVLCRRLEREGYETAAAPGGREALELLARGGFDLVLLDFMMPEMTGSEVLAIIKSTPALSHLPVIMISAMDDTARVVRCIELGAEDYLSKPFDPVLLRARIGASLEKKRLRDDEQRRAGELAEALRAAEEQKLRSDSLLRNILPGQIAQELVAKGDVEPKYFEDVTIVFTDFVGFTLSTETIAAEDLVLSLHQYFTEFDHIVARYGLEKLKTIGDSYMFAGGLPARSSSSPVDAVLACFEILRAAEELSARPEMPSWQMRIGVHTGPVIAGIVGINKFAFDVWGATVNFASRMESAGAPGRINVSEHTYTRVKDFFACEHRGKVLTKEKKEFDMYFANGIAPALVAGNTEPVPPKFLRRYRVYFQREPQWFPGFLVDPAEREAVKAAE